MIGMSNDNNFRWTGLKKMPFNKRFCEVMKHCDEPLTNLLILLVIILHLPKWKTYNLSHTFHFVLFLYFNLCKQIYVMVYFLSLVCRLYARQSSIFIGLLDKEIYKYCSFHSLSKQNPTVKCFRKFTTLLLMEWKTLDGSKRGNTYNQHFHDTNPP